MSMASMAVCRTAGRGSKPRRAAKFLPRALGPQPSFTRKGGSVQFTDEVPNPPSANLKTLPSDADLSLVSWGQFRFNKIGECSGVSGLLLQGD